MFGWGALSRTAAKARAGFFASKRSADPAMATMRSAAADAQKSRLPQMAAALSYRTIFGLLPVIIVATREAIRSIPIHLKEGAYGIGCDQWQVMWHYVLPSARPGILTGIIVGLSRAIGETAPVITIGALTFVAFLPPAPVTSSFPFLSFDWLNSAFTVMPIQMFNWISRPQAEFHTNAAATGLVLLAMTLLMNALAVVIRFRLRAAQKG